MIEYQSFFDPDKEVDYCECHVCENSQGFEIRYISSKDCKCKNNYTFYANKSVVFHYNTRERKRIKSFIIENKENQGLYVCDNCKGFGVEIRIIMDDNFLTDDIAKGFETMICWRCHGDGYLDWVNHVKIGSIRTY